MIKDKRKFFLISGIVVSILVFFIIIVPICVRLIIVFSHPWSDEVEGVKLSHKIMEAIEAEDSDKLKWLFCKQSIATQDLDEQIEGAFEFIEGSITSELNRRDIGASGGAMASGGEITELSIDSDIKGISTDAGKKYRIRFYGYAVNQKYEETVGISELTIYDEGSDEKYTIGEYIR